MTNTRHREEETQNTNSHLTTRKQLKIHTKKPALKQHDDCITRKDTKYSTIRSVYRHVVCNVPVSCDPNGDRNQMGCLDSNLIVE